MKILLFLLAFISTTINAQNVLHAGEPDWADSAEHTDESSFQMKATTAACGTPFLSTGYPAWTNYWAGWMVKIINTNACPIVINSFEARFQGTAGYRIYTKAGTFIGFETTAGSWALVGNLATLTGTSVTAPTSIPIAVNVTIPIGGSQSFYLTRSDNVIANRHLYIAGAGTAGTTIYASNVDLSITEGEYVDPYFAALQVGTRRPSFDVCYSIACVLPIELVSFDGYNRTTYNQLSWITESETNNKYFTIERSIDAQNWMEIDKIDGAGSSSLPIHYEYKDLSFVKDANNYYRLKQTDYNEQYKYSSIIVVSNNPIKTVKNKKTYNMMGNECGEYLSPGLYIEHIEYIDNTTEVKKIIINND
jgi:hypothetical protein